jgi:hypothetical protein
MKSFTGWIIPGACSLECLSALWGWWRLRHPVLICVFKMDQLKAQGTAFLIAVPPVWLCAFFFCEWSNAAAIHVAP